MPAPLISVIMPAYNAEQYIAESMESVMQQTYTNWELLVVDDGSTDGTKNIIKSYCAKDERIKYLWQQNGKQGKARNLALAQAKGDHIAFLDADDIWLPGKLTVQLKEIEEKKADLVFSEAFVFTDNKTDASHLMGSGKGYFKGDKGLESFLELNKIPILTVLVKAAAINRAKGFTEKPSIQNAEDYHLWLRLLVTGDVFYGSEQVLAGYRQHAGSSTLDDKLAVSKVIEALNDLKENFNGHSEVINYYLKQWFRRCHYSTGAWDKTNYKHLITKNCRYVDKPGYNFMLQTAYAFFGFKVTRKLIGRMLNNSLVL